MSTLSYQLQHMGHNITVLDTPANAAPQCLECDGTGYIHYDVPINDPRFGKLFRCPSPTCPIWVDRLHTQSEAVMKARGSWKADYDAMTFASFQALLGKQNNPRWDGKRGAYAAAMAFARASAPFTLNEASQNAFKHDWPKADPGASVSVGLTGGVGIGKTGLARAAQNDLRAQGKIGIYIRLSDLITHIQEAYKFAREGEETGETRIQILASAPYLIIDEFETDDYTTDRKRIVEAVMRGRADRPNMLPFMFTTNLTQEEFYAKWGQRIADIVAKAHLIEMGGLKLRPTRQTTKEVW